MVIFLIRVPTLNLLPNIPPHPLPMYIIGTPHIFLHIDVHTSCTDLGGTVGGLCSDLYHTCTGYITVLPLK